MSSTSSGYVYSNGETEGVFTAFSSNVFELSKASNTIDSQAQTFSYDGSGRLTQVVNTDSSTTSISYAAGSDTITEPGGRTVTLTLDASNNLTRINDAASFARTLAYVNTNADNVHLLDSDSWNPYSTGFTYNATNDLISTVSPAGSDAWTFAPAASDGLTNPPPLYNPSGLIATVTDGLSSKATYFLNADGEEAFAQNPNGNTQSWTLSDGLVLDYIDGVGNSTSYGYDSLGSMTSMTSPGGGTTLYTYTADAFHRVAAMSAELSVVMSTGVYAVTSYQYSSGYLTEEISPNSGTTFYGYNTLGLMTSMTDALGNATDYSYNINRLETQELAYTGSSTSDFIESFSYNAAGNLVQTILGNTDTMIATFNGDGNQTSQTDYLVSGTTTLTASLTSEMYDAAGMMTRSITAGSITTNFTYNGNGDLLTQTDFIGSATASFVSNTYNTLHHLIASTQGPNTVSYTYDSDGNVQTKTDINAAGTASFETDSYDADDRLLTSVRGSGLMTTSYSYDSDGNVLTQAEFSSGSTAAVGTVTYSYNLDDQLVFTLTGGSNAIAYTYDNDGNLSTQIDYITSGATASFTTDTYDSDDRLILAVHGPDTSSYTYDGVGNMLFETDFIGSAIATETTDSYNLAGQMTLSVHGPDTTTYTLDADGRTLTQTDEIGTAVGAL